MTVKWNVDSATDLFKSEDGYRIRWAGAFFGPCQNLDELVADDLLDQCKSLIQTQGEACKIVTVDSPCDSYIVEIPA